MEKLIVGKELKNIYEFLNRVYAIFNKAPEDRTALFLTQKGRLIYSSPKYAGSLKIQQNNITILSEALDGSKYYAISRLPGDRYMLKALLMDDVSEQCRIDIDKAKGIVTRFNKKICDIESDEISIISKLSRLSNTYIGDHYFSSIAKFGKCEAYIGDRWIMLSKEFYDDKNYQTIFEKLVLPVLPYDEVEESVQEMMFNHEEETA